jgi:hypothetical protein
VGEFLVAVLSSLVATGVVEVSKLLLANSKGGGLMFPGMANLLPA